MNRNATPTVNLIVGQQKQKRRVLIAGGLLGLALILISLAVVQYTRSRAAWLREATAVTGLLSLGAEIEDQPAAPLAALLPGTGAAGYRLAIKLRDPGVTDDSLTVLDEFDAGRVGSLDLLNCAVGDATLARGAIPESYASRSRTGTPERIRAVADHPN